MGESSKRFFSTTLPSGSFFEARAICVASFVNRRLPGWAIPKGTPAIGEAAERFTSCREFLLNRNDSVVSGEHSGGALACPRQLALVAVVDVDVVGQLSHLSAKGVGGIFIRHRHVEVNEHWHRHVGAIVGNEAEGNAVRIVWKIVYHEVSAEWAVRCIYVPERFKRYFITWMKHVTQFDGDQRSQRRYRLTTPLVLIAIAGSSFVAWAMFLKPAMDEAKDALCRANLFKLRHALFEYDGMHGTLPPAYVTGGDGKPAHSWRALIMPYLDSWGIDEKAFNANYDFKQPWDASAHGSSKNELG